MCVVQRCVHRELLELRRGLIQFRLGEVMSQERLPGGNDSRELMQWNTCVYGGGEGGGGIEEEKIA